ncbi:ankyrin repeat domain-containing protein [Flammeovirga aprica]|uniref:Ankyrin repeat domain-containing protein n=1 Tax=Flammeovirga aprica JL-4 TaxID=694437 RepID=A0A7X9XCN8_9BACT|nr:ankyrin repeat domain-containing protein [Flammeovirga aprica]NME72026.1 ankyrin repeat domain-containing protein [Flammeovirga aprica JL-4]
MSDLSKEKKLINDIFNSINLEEYVYIIMSKDLSCASGLYKINEGLIEYVNETVDVFKTYSDSIQEVFKGVGLVILYKDEKNEPLVKKIPFFNPELSNQDMFELTLFQEFGLRPTDPERQEVLKKSIKSEKIKNTLVYACYENDTDKILDRLNKVGKSQLDKNLKYTGTPLGLCVSNNNYECFKAIAEAGANIKRKSLGRTPLFLAFNHSKEIVEYYYSDHKEYFIQEVQKQGFYLAAGMKDVQILELLKKLGADLMNNEPAFPHIHNFVDWNNIVGIEFCLNNGVDINLKDKYNRTPLDKAVIRGHKESIEYLEKKMLENQS